MFDRPRIDAGALKKVAAPLFLSGIDMEARLAIKMVVELRVSQPQILLACPEGEDRFAVVCLCRVTFLLEGIRSATRGDSEAMVSAESAGLLAFGSLEVVLMSFGKGGWLRVQSEADSQDLLKILVDCSRKSLPRIYDVRAYTAERGNLYHSGLREKVEALSHRSKQITRDTAYECWKIDGWDLQVLTSLASGHHTRGDARTQRDLINQFKLPRQLLLAFVSQEEAERLTEEGFWDDEDYVEPKSFDEFEDDGDASHEDDADAEDADQYESDNELDENIEKKDDQELDDGEVEDVLGDESQGSGKPRTNSSRCGHLKQKIYTQTQRNTR